MTVYECNNCEWFDRDEICDECRKRHRHPVPHIDIETYQNDKRLLLAERDDLKAQVKALNIMKTALIEELAKAYDQIHTLTAEVNHLTDLVEGSYDH